MRADRLVSILLLLQTNTRLTARQLSKRLEVSERTILRDMDALSAAGVPVVAERGASGGWSLLEPYRTNLNGLTQAEIQTLFLAAPGKLLADLGLRKANESAIIKLLSAIPSVSRRDAEYARQRIHIDTTGWRAPSVESVAMLPVLQDAVWRERKVKMVYRRDECEPSERLVDPLGLVAKGSVWYLVAGVEGDIRSYRVSRVMEAHILDEPASRPKDFDLAAHWQRSAAEFKAKLPRYYVTVRATPRAEFWLAWQHRIETRLEDGLLRLRFDAEEEALISLLGLGTMIEIMEPAVLRDRVLAEARAVADSYAALANRR